MRIDLRSLAAAGAIVFALPFNAFAQGAAADVPMLDPWVPPALKAKAAASRVGATQGAALRADAEAKLKARFDAAAGEVGTLTRGEAAARGLGAIARDFEAIDRRGAGRITFEDYRQFLRAGAP
ncbi:MAG: hypothetical protein ABIR98_07260 [Usitatibacter sp.]